MASEEKMFIVILYRYMKRIKKRNSLYVVHFVAKGQQKLIVYALIKHGTIKIKNKHCLSNKSNINQNEATSKYYYSL